MADVSSTNDICLEHARSSEKGGLWVTANRQLGGRGRRGRAWVSEPGNLYASLFLLEDDISTDFSALPLAVSIALSRAIDRVLPMGAQRSQIKWPNDVLINGAKVSGILLETEKLVNGKRAIIIGCGVNIAHHPEESLYPTISINSLGASVSPQELFTQLYSEMQIVLDIWKQSDGIAVIRKLWLEKAAGIGKSIKVNLPRRTLDGLFVGLAGNGNLILRQDDGESVEISAGDVFFDK
ncbi:biotin--[acetyl-CoA-carboxylase] ligase [Lentilitoribacter sp. Alg239-R112]|uniref:biotin--[acetyl-CoA-carboxylase] ligase n=1 Tax=Lentilitoribacter sp. Alg239-R112 TaxID=2305987 RepID=UPI0013A6A54D|nr:biotin--[acetyl-CoA-carboxylase] ligase [Lentilitoribacter sp. Alg239-R112]